MEKYYEQYLKNHSEPKVKLFHFVGQLATLAYICFCLGGGFFWWLLGSPFIVYPFAVSSHYIFGKKGNQPSFHEMGYFRAKVCDLMMFVDILKRKHKIW